MNESIKRTLQGAPFFEASMDVQLIEDAFLQDVLSPYRLHCRYLQHVGFQQTAEGVVFHGLFAIPDSCYIDDTGHFNAVEFNICYNQIAYCYMAYCINQRLDDALHAFSLNTFFDKQLSNFLITQTQAKYPSSLNAKQFRASFKILHRRDTRYGVRMQTACEFNDMHTGRAAGEVTLAVLSPHTQAA